MGLKVRIWALRLGFEPQGWDFSLMAGILASRLKFEPQGWDLSLKAGICRNTATTAMLFLSYYYTYGAAADLMTAGRQLLVRSVCVWEEGMAVSQSGFWVSEERKRSTNNSLFLFLVSLFIALMMF